MTTPQKKAGVEDDENKDNNQQNKEDASTLGMEQ